MASTIVSNATGGAVRGAQQSLDTHFRVSDRDALKERLGIMGEVRLIGGAVVTILILALVLNEVYDSIEINDTSPWYEIVGDLESTGVAALGLLIVALLVLAAAAILRVMGNSGFGGR